MRLRAQCDDRDALELLLRCVQPSLRRYVAGLIGAADADDVVQDVLIQVSRTHFQDEK
jgi:DNA-directed RNA polymerase specialized sigma24 family protein